MKIISQTCENIYIEKNSKFIAIILKVENKNEIKLKLSEIKKQYSKANHYVYAYKILENETLSQKSIDAGEPKNTAGKPLLEIINHFDLINTLMVVVRYFGGTKLGAGGLTRAYLKSAKLCVENIKLVEYEKKVEIIINFEYNQIDFVNKILNKYNEKIIEKHFDDKVMYKLYLINKCLEELKKIQNINIC